MLSWPPGPRASDGVWAPYWYDKVLDSGGFEPRGVHQSQVPPGYRDIIDAVMPSFEVLFARRLL
jgi:hypothetical protein